MYIRRKVFSLLQDEMGEERYFSTREILLENEEERLFSLVEDDEDLEQREFGNKENKAKRKAWERKQADNLGAAIENKTGFKMTPGDKVRAYRLKNVADTHGGVARYIDADTGKYIDILSDAVELDDSGNNIKRTVNHRINTRAINKSKNGKITKSGLLRDINQDAIISDLGDTNNVHINADRYEKIRTGGGKMKTSIEKSTKEATEKVAKKGSRFGKAGKVALGTAAVLGTAYGAKKLYDRKKKK